MSSGFSRELTQCNWPLSVAELRALGVPRTVLRGLGWRNTTYGFWAPATAGLTTAQRILDASPLVAETDGFTGWAAAYVSGVDQLDGLNPFTMQPEPVPIALGGQSGRRCPPGVDYLRSPVAADELSLRHALRLTSPLRAAFDGVRLSRNLPEAVGFADACAHAGMIELASFRGYVSGHNGWKGVALARSAAELADPAARSTWESRLRVFYVTIAGLPRPEVNRPVFDLDGRLLGIPDLLDERAGLVTEFDGQDHRSRSRHRTDNVREESFESAGRWSAGRTAWTLHITVQD